MTVRPILFSAPMVRGIIREISAPGTGKTQTRRTIKKARTFATHETSPFTLAGADLDRALQNASHFRRIDGNGWEWESDAFAYQAPATRTRWLAHIGPAPGDRLWVRETWAASEMMTYYAADGEPLTIKWRPSIHMPRHISRITLAVTDVRIERLQDISRQDAIAEGLIEIRPDRWWFNDEPEAMGCRDPILAYSALWNRINGPGAWEANPWVSVISFLPVAQAEVSHG